MRSLLRRSSPLPPPPPPAPHARRGAHLGDGAVVGGLPAEEELLRRREHHHRRLAQARRGVRQQREPGGINLRELGLDLKHLREDALGGGLEREGLFNQLGDPDLEELGHVDDDGEQPVFVALQRGEVVARLESLLLAARLGKHARQHLGEAA